MIALSRFGLAALFTLPLAAACSDTSQQFAPVCPRPAILRGAGDLQRFRDSGQDFLDTALQGRITGISGSCTRDGPTRVAATVSVALELTRGPAAVGRSTDVAFFIAVSKGDRVLDKQVYTLHPSFPENTDRLRLSGDSVELLLPVTSTQGADAYQVTAGFQLTPAQLAYNRRQLQRGR